MMQTPKTQRPWVRAIRNTLLAYFALALLAATFCLSMERCTIDRLGAALFGMGIVVFVIGTISLGRSGLRGSSMMDSPYVRDENFFKKARAAEQPFEAIVIPVVLASIAAAVTGYFLIGVR